MQREDDQALLERFRQGDHGAFALLVARYQGPIYNAACRVLGNADDASDVTQAVFLRIAQKTHEYDPQYKFFSWIYRMAVNEALNILRRNRRDEPLVDEEDLPGPESANPEWQAQQLERSRQVQAALMGMKADDRIVIALRHFSDCSYVEIGRILGLDEATVKSRLYEARQRLKALLKDRLQVE